MAALTVALSHHHQYCCTQYAGLWTVKAVAPACQWRIWSSWWAYPEAVFGNPPPHHHQTAK
jgi:hypothetical protein